MKPISTLMKPLRSVDLTTMTESPAPRSSAATSAPCRRPRSSARRWWRWCWPTRCSRDSAATRSATIGGAMIGPARSARAMRQARPIARARPCPARPMIRPILRYGARAAAQRRPPPVTRLRRRPAAADRRHDRDDVRRARHRAGGAAGRRAAADLSSSTSRSAAIRRS